VSETGELESLASGFRLDEKNEVTRIGGVKYTVKDGIVYDARKLLADVRKMVKEAKEKGGRCSTSREWPAKTRSGPS
jgi:hypothetical protein